MLRRLILLPVALSLVLCGEEPRPGYSLAEEAYRRLADNDLDAAVAAFNRALELEPARAVWRKDLAYVLLRTGDRESARDHFERLWRENPKDEISGLEYGYLCFETRREREAHLAFLELKDSPSEQTRTAAVKAFDSIDTPLGRNIARWQEALERAPGQWSAHEELARLAEQRNDNALAAKHYREAWRLRPTKTDLLVDLARVLERQGAASETRKALATAWHFGSPRVREAAVALSGGGEPAAGVEPWPVPKEPAPKNLGARRMAELSLEKSYLQDAYRYYREAVAENPEDFESLYQLGVVSNLLGDNRQAVEWFRAARLAPDRVLASRARNAYAKLWPSFQKFRLSAWAIPFYSSRWGDAFVYGQGRAEWRPTSKQVWLYGSFRIIGDTGSSGEPVNAGGGIPPALSERTMILGGGILWKVNYRLSLWGEAGESYRYAHVEGVNSLLRPDYRGGFSYLKGWGRLMGAGRRGWFAESSLDGFYVSRFDNDMLLYAQARAGYTLKPFRGGPQLQFVMSLNVTRDLNGEYWGNFLEAGPGVRLSLPGLPTGMSVRVDFLRGAHLNNSRNPLGPNYWDLRAGLWYALVY
jgi:tetratricopeptide (TPR) repeat protein